MVVMCPLQCELAVVEQGEHGLLCTRAIGSERLIRWAIY